MVHSFEPQSLALRVYSLASTGASRESKEVSVEGRMTALRSKLVGNDALGFNLQDSALDEHILWYAQQQLKEVVRYKEAADRLEETVELFDYWWYLRDADVRAPKCLGDAFEVLLVVVFLNANHDNFFKEHDDVAAAPKLCLGECAAFVCAFHDYAESHWKDRILTCLYHVNYHVCDASQGL